MPDVSRVGDANPIYVTLESAALAGEMRQLRSGRAAWFNSAVSARIGSQKPYTDVGQAAVPKATGIVILDGGKVYWDFSAGNATYRQVDDQDFLIGTAVGTAQSADAAMVVNLNVAPVYKVDLLRDPFTSAIVGTQALGGLAINDRGGALNFKLSSTSEAQKLDALSKDGFSTAANAIVEFAFNVVDAGSGSVVDINIGAANTTNATDADSIADQLFVHFDAGSTAIKLQSKDGTTTVSATDSTKTFTAGAGNANRVEGWLDMSNPADCQCYINGVLVLSSTVFDVSASSNAWKLLFHIEKTSSTDAYEIDLEWLRTRTAKQ